MKKNRSFSLIISVLMALVLIVPAGQQFLSRENQVSAATQVSLTNVEAKDGIILQLHTWSFNNIKSKLSEIAAAGYKCVQVSPIQGAKAGTQWWTLYQPTNQTIGNQLGSRKEFEEMCTEAELYGIDVIVDAVMNHMASGSTGDSISSEVVSEFQRSDFYHNLGQCSNWKDRWSVTQQGIGLPDLNTQHSEVQAKAIAFLNECVTNGADGFRFDAAKHIETNIGEDANKSWAGNYWNNVLGNLNNRSNLFIYGEVLDEPNSNSDNISAYATFMSLTDHSYGAIVRNAVKSYNLSAAQSWGIELPVGKRVSYVENHDNFEHNESGLTDDQRKLAWGIMAARANVTPMYLSRRTGSLGSIGTSDWGNEEIKAVNWFHNAMIGQTEYMRYANNNNCTLVDRGTKGTAIINVGGSFSLNSTTNLENGTYTDKGGSGASFTVSGGTITGTVPGNRVIVLYDGGIINDAVVVNPATPVIGELVTVTYNATSRVLSGANNVNIYYGYDGWVLPKTVAMTKTDINKWTVTFTVPSATKGKLNIVFNNGSGTWDNNSAKDWNFTCTGTVITISNIAYFDNSTLNWSTVNVYAYDESSSPTKQAAPWPGVTMTNEGNGLYSYSIPEGWSNPQVIFNNGSTQIPASTRPGFVVSGKMIYKNGAWITYTEEEITTSIKAYFDNASYNWSNVNIYVYDDSTSTVKTVSAWPGVAMTKEASGLYSYTLPATWSTAKVIFNYGSAQTPASNQPGYVLTKNMILRSGTWSAY